MLFSSCFNFRPPKIQNMRARLISLVTAGLLLSGPPAFSQTQMLEGTIISLRPGLIIVDIWGGDEEYDFKIDRTTAFQRFDSLDDLTFGDKVSIYYRGKEYLKTATAIIKEIPTKDIPVI
jgi:hypothetical protein